MSDHHPETPAPHGLGAIRRWPSLLGWLGATALTGAVGGLASRDAASFYGALEKPTWAPPGWLFAPVWSVLYLLMGIAAWLVWRTQPAALSPQGSVIRRVGLGLFVGQLVLNALWTWLFFAWRRGALAFGEIVLLWLAVALTTWHFARVRALAAWCLAPYLAWVLFAAALTWAVWHRNPGLL